MKDRKIIKQTKKIFKSRKCGKSQSTFKCFLSTFTKAGLSTSACEKVTQHKHIFET